MLQPPASRLSRQAQVLVVMNDSPTPQAVGGLTLIQPQAAQVDLQLLVDGVGRQCV